MHAAWLRGTFPSGLSSRSRCIAVVSAQTLDYATQRVSTHSLGLTAPADVNRNVPGSSSKLPYSQHTTGAPL